MNLITNSVTPNEVVEETRDGDRYLVVQDVPFIKPMELSGGYVPEKYIKQTANQWSDTLLTANHPRDSDGKPVRAEQKADEVGIGAPENPRFDGEHVRVDMAVNADRATAMGGAAADIVEAIENGDPFDVSSQYIPVDLPAGEYDGEYRSNVEGIAEPDSIALLPHKKGQCSLENGCGINPELVANSEVSLPITDDGTPPEEYGITVNKSVGGISYTGVSSGDLDESEIPNDDFQDHYVFDGETKTESSFPLVDGDGNLRKANVAAAFRFRDDAPDKERLLEILAAVNDEWDDPPIDPESLQAAMGGDMSDNSRWGWLKSFLGLTSNSSSSSSSKSDPNRGETAGAESPVDPDSTMDRDKLIDEITANSPLTEDTLSERCDEGLEAIHEDIVSNETETETENESDGTVTDNTEYVEITESELEDMVAEKAAEMVANKQAESEKESLAAEIVANSAEYEDTESVLEDYPTKAALKTKKESVTEPAAMPGMGATANAGESDDFEDISAGVFD